MERRLEITIRPELGGDAEYRYRELQRMGDALVTAGTGLYNEATNQLVEHQAETNHSLDDDLDEVTSTVADLVEAYAASSDRTIEEAAAELKELLFGHAKIPEPIFGKVNLDTVDHSEPHYPLMVRTPYIEELLRTRLDRLEEDIIDVDDDRRHADELRRALGEPTREEELMGDHPDAP